MTITIELTPEQEGHLNARASQQGKTAVEFARELVLQDSTSLSSTPDTAPRLPEPGLQKTNPAEWLRLLHSIGQETGVSLSDDAVSRDSLYGDHD